MSVNSWIRRQFANGVSPSDTLAGGMGAGDTSFLFTSGASFPAGGVGPFIVTVDQGKANEEKILVQTRSGTAATVASGGRGYNGTTAASHLSGASVLHTIDAQDFDEANQVVVATLGAIAAKGDVLTGSGAHALAKTTVGADGTVLLAHAAAPGGVQWAIPSQVVLPSCRVHLATNLALTSGLNGRIAFDTVDFDSASAYSLGSKNYVVPITGTYLVTMGMVIDSSATIAKCSLGQTGSASTDTEGPDSSTLDPVSGLLSVSFAAMRRCVVGDLLFPKLYIQAGVGPLEGGDSLSYMAISMVGT